MFLQVSLGFLHRNQTHKLLKRFEGFEPAICPGGWYGVTWLHVEHRSQASFFINSRFVGRRQWNLFLHSWFDSGDGMDPAAKRKDTKRLAVFRATNTFSAVALEWHELNKHRWTPEYARKLRRWLEMHLFPALENRPVREIAPLKLLDILRTIEKRKATHLAHALLELCRAVFRFAIVTSRATSNPASELEGALAPHVAKHYPTIQAKELLQLFTTLESARTSEQNRLAIKLLMHTFVRTGELRVATWNEFDVAAAEWHIPAENTKMRDRHIVPLSSQAVQLLERLRQLTGGSPYLFPAQ